MKAQIARFLAVALTATATTALAQNETDAVPVTVDNFIRAETDMYFGSMVKAGRLWKVLPSPRTGKHRQARRHPHEPRHALFLGVVRSRCRPVTITMPDAGKRFMSMMIVDEDHYVPAVYYGAGSHTLTRDKIGTRYVMAIVRTLVDPADQKDVQQVHALQDELKASQKSTGKFEVPNWDQASQKKVRDALLVLNTTISDFKNAFGARGKVDPVMHLIGTASGWGGNPDKDATYARMTPPKNDGTTVYKLNVKNVPVDGFWSVSVYNEAGYFEKNPYNSYSLNNITAKKEADGSIAIQFGGCDGKIPNCIPIMKGWNAAVRLYRPRAEILNGKWKFPEAQPAAN